MMDFVTESWMKTASAGIGVMIAASSAGYGVMSWHDRRYALTDDVVQIEMRLDQKILSDRLSQVQQRIWRLEEKYGESLNAKENETAWEEYRQLKEERERIREQLHDMQSIQMQQMRPGK
jgi:beta-glucosidase-like glycosyl hydrolase